MLFVAPTFAGFGIVADTRQLRQDLHTCGQNERKNLRSKQWSDMTRVAEIVDRVQARGLREWLDWLAIGGGDRVRRQLKEVLELELFREPRMFIPMWGIRLCPS